MDIQSPTLLKVKGGLFLFLGMFSGALLLLPQFSWQSLALLVLTIWSFCRAYYFCFYVLQHYVDPRFRYAGLGSALRFLIQRRRPNREAS